jgi:ribonucleoside-diphosphate reductase alpha chain
MNDLRDYIWNRQYALTPGESYRDGLRRVAHHIAQAETRYKEDPKAWEERFFTLMDAGRFMPGGRILAGAGSEHGNLLNCFVVDGAPETPGSTNWALHLAQKLALITKVGGGTGLNLDPIAPKKPYNGPMGRVYLHIDNNHPNADDVYAGRIINHYTGEKVERGYRAIQSGSSNAHLLTVQDSIEGIWGAAGEMVRLLLSGKDVTLDLSALRPEGAPVKGSGGTSSGPASFAVEVFDNFAYWASLGAAEYAGPVATLRYVFAPTLRAIRQGGSRRGAGMATLSIEHPDWEDFLTAKDLDREAVEGDISTYNISFLVPDSFMHYVQKDVLRRIAEHAHATGEPGLIFVDTVNRHNPLNPTDGPILATNPLSHSGLVP